MNNVGTINLAVYIYHHLIRYSLMVGGSAVFYVRDGSRLDLISILTVK